MYFFTNKNNWLYSRQTAIIAMLIMSVCTLGFSLQTQAQPYNDDCFSAEFANIENPYDDCTFLISGTTIAATDDGYPLPSCDVTGPVQDVWYEFNSGVNTTVRMQVIAPGLTPPQEIGIQVLDACGGTEIYCNWQTQAFLSEVLVTPATQYVFRIYTNLAFDPPTDFDLCLQGNNLKTWTGAVNTDWFNAANWLPTDAPPTADQTVTIPDGAFNYPDINAPGAFARNILIQSAASLTIQSGASLVVDGQSSIADGILNLGSLTNNGIMEVLNTTEDGIETQGNISNFGEIHINNAGYGMYVWGPGSMANNGEIKIGQNAPIAFLAVEVDGGIFTNAPCALIHVYSDNRIVDGANTLTNNGIIIENSSENSSVGVNNGEIYNLNGGTFTVVSGTAAVNTTMVPTCFVTCGSCGCAHPNDYTALRALYLATDGDNWTNNTNWPNAATFMANTTPPAGTDMSTWHGITCDGTDRISIVDLEWNQLNGTLPSELGNLSNLVQLDLRLQNQLTGTIPAELGNLSNLELLELGDNSLTGSIPPELGNLSNLVSLYLNRNDLTGSIPTELGNLSNLQRMALSGNDLTGGIPTELGNLPNLITMYLGGNDLSGSIPVELSNLSNLAILNLGFNQLSGSIPSELGNLSNLVELELNENQLSGSIPVELGNLSNLEVLELGFNQLSGSIPSELGNLSNLVELELNDNQLSGCFPSSLSALCDIYYGYGPDFSNNPDLPGGGDFTAFCADGTGQCQGVTVHAIVMLEGAYIVGYGQMQSSLVTNGFNRLRATLCPSTVELYRHRERSFYSQCACQCDRLGISRIATC